MVMPSPPAGEDAVNNNPNTSQSSPKRLLCVSHGEKRDNESLGQSAHDELMSSLPHICYMLACPEDDPSEVHSPCHLQCEKEGQRQKNKCSVASPTKIPSPPHLKKSISLNNVTATLSLKPMLLDASKAKHTIMKKIEDCLLKLKLHCFARWAEYSNIFNVKASDCYKSEGGKDQIKKEDRFIKDGIMFNFEQIQMTHKKYEIRG